jgi:uncharacterized protein (DUF2235 family)
VKRLIVCCDGTWNSADQECPTNVEKLRRALAPEDHDGNPQIACYVEGVGTKRRERLIGGGLGVGLSRNVQLAYRFLVENYEPHDELYFFGFSRGAFTARSTVGVVRNSGILRPDCRDQVEAAYELYRSRKPDDEPNGKAAKEFRQRYSHPDPEIQFVGVWDTVGALGIPIDGFRPPLISRMWRFHDTTLSSAVRHAYHAVSIDERRRPFKPTLWVEKETGAVATTTKDQTVEQVWFAGVHSDVGGGYPDPSLAEIPLRWMVERATACGLAFDPERLVLNRERIDALRRNAGFDVAPDHRGLLHDSLSLMYRLLIPYDRRLNPSRGVAVNPALAGSAEARYDEDTAYRPRGFDAWRAAGRPTMPVPDGREVRASAPGR